MSVALSASTKLAPGREVIWREVAGEVVLLNPDDSVIMGLNATGGSMWRMLDGVRSLGDIAELIAAEFDAPSEQILADLVSFAGELVRRGLVVEP